MPWTVQEIAAQRHRALNPLGEAKLVELGALIGVGRDTCVLDLACGKGELLCRWAQRYGAHGVGIDHSKLFVAAARTRAAELGVADKVRIGHGDAAAYHPEPGGYHVAACLGATEIGGGVAGTIELLRPAVGAGGVLLVGEPFLVAPGPGDPAHHTLGELLDVFDAAGTDLIEMVAADHDGWDRYVAAQWWTTRAWLDGHPDHPEAPQARAFLDESRRRYLTEQRGRLGWAIFALRPAR